MGLVEIASGGALVVIAAAWLVLTVCNHVPRLPAFIGRILGTTIGSIIVPRWNFFAPNPGTSVYTLLYRDFFRGEVASGWRVLLAPPENGAQWTHAVWNPGKTVSKEFLDVVQGLVAIRLEAEARHEPDAVVVSIPYLAFLLAVEAVPRLHFADMTQFLIMETDSSGVTRPLFCSRLHGIDNGRPT